MDFGDSGHLRCPCNMREKLTLVQLERAPRRRVSGGVRASHNCDVRGRLCFTNCTQIKHETTKKLHASMTAYKALNKHMPKHIRCERFPTLCVRWLGVLAECFVVANSVPAPSRCAHELRSLQYPSCVDIYPICFQVPCKTTRRNDGTPTSIMVDRQRGLRN